MHKLDFLQQKKLNPADELRELLASLEDRQIDLKSMSSTQALMLLRDLDQVYVLFNQLEAVGVDLLSEKSRFKAVQARLKRSARHILKALGGPKVLAQYRPAPAPAPEQWWWHIHEQVAREQHQFRRRVMVVLAVVTIVFGGIILAFNTILAPAPEVVARMQAENEAYTAIQAGDYEAALATVEAGLQQVPGDPGLTIFKGVLHSILGQNREATESFEQAQSAIGDPQIFYFSRGQLNLRLNQALQAEEDARQALAVDENSSDGWLLLGQALEAQGRRFEAIQAYETAGDLALAEGNNQVVVLARLALGRIGTSSP